MKQPPIVFNSQEAFEAFVQLIRISKEVSKNYVGCGTRLGRFNAALDKVRPIMDDVIFDMSDAEEIFKEPQPLTMVAVISSNIEAIGYLEDVKELFIKFKGFEGVYVYLGVEAVQHKNLMEARSHGAYMNRHIQGNYSYTLRGQ